VTTSSKPNENVQTATPVTSTAQTPASGEASEGGLPAKDCEPVSQYIEKASSGGPSRGGVPVVPNGTLLTGIVHCVQQVEASNLGIEPEMTISVASIEILEAQDVKGVTNRLAGQEGETIVVLSKDQIPESAVGGRVQALVSFRGDEHGGAYWSEEESLMIEK
jgi:hypothetical protein